MAAGLYQKLGCKFYISPTHSMEHWVEVTWLVAQLQKREMPHLERLGSKAITPEIPTLLETLFTFPLSSCYGSIKLHRKNRDVCSQVPFVG